MFFEFFNGDKICAAARIFEVKKCVRNVIKQTVNCCWTALRAVTAAGSSTKLVTPHCPPRQQQQSPRFCGTIASVYSIRKSAVATSLSSDRCRTECSLSTLLHTKLSQFEDGIILVNNC